MFFICNKAAYCRIAGVSQTYPLPVYSAATSENMPYFLVF